MRKPEFLCIGAQKAGTTWFHKVMASRPDIWVPPIKEMHFFDYLHGADTQRWAKGHINKAVKQAMIWHVRNAEDISLNYMEYLSSLARSDMFTRRWYARVWERAPEGRMALDATPEYSCISEEGVAYFRKMLPSSKLVYILRDPVARAVSQIRMNLARRGKVPSSIDEWVAEASRPEIDNRGDYRSYVPRWKAAYGEAQLLFMPFGQIAAAPAQFMEKIEQFYGLAPYAYPALREKVHGARGADLPAQVKELLRARYTEQYRFLQGEFAPEFLAQL